MSRALVLATRRSPLALAQSRAVAAALTGHGHTVTLLELVTTGDRWSAADAQPAPDRGMFVKELEEALLDGRADVAVHSAKDLPGELPPGLAVLAAPPREDPRDVLVGVPGGLGDLPAGARVGTGSPRRAAQLRAVRPDLDVVGIRGNVDTRLRKLREGRVDALVLAAAGLRRLDVWPDDATPLDVGVSTPAPGQGLLALEGRTGDERVRGALAPLADPVSAACLVAERAVLLGLGGGCMTPVGALCAPHGDGLRIIAFRSADDRGTDALRVTVDGDADDPAGLGARAAAILLGEAA